MPNLAVFDFDRTIIDDDSDAAVIRSLGEKNVVIPEWDTKDEWTTYMNSVFAAAHGAGLGARALLAPVLGLRPAPGAAGLLRALRDAGWRVLLLTDANSVFVESWLEASGLRDTVTDVLTNPAAFTGERLVVRPLMDQTACARCPRNLCKWQALSAWRRERSGDDERGDERSGERSGERGGAVIYVGDGRNDLCPAVSLPSGSTVYPRRGYPLEALLLAEGGRAAARVVPWDHADTIVQDLFPGETVDTGS